MANIEPRVTKGRRKSYRVKWRLGSARDGASQSETFHHSGSPLTFKLAVEAAGHLWRDNYIKRVGWIEESESDDAEPLDTPSCSATMR